MIEQEIREQIRGINQSITSIEAIEVLTPMPGVSAIVTVLGAMRKNWKKNLSIYMNSIIHPATITAPPS